MRNSENISHIGRSILKDSQQTTCLRLQILSKIGKQSSSHQRCSVRKVFIRNFQKFVRIPFSQNTWTTASANLRCMELEPGIQPYARIEI